MAGSHEPGDPRFFIAGSPPPVTASHRAAMSSAPCIAFAVHRRRASCSAHSCSSVALGFASLQDPALSERVAAIDRMPPRAATGTHAFDRRSNTFSPRIRGFVACALLA